MRNGGERREGTKPRPRGGGGGEGFRQLLRFLFKKAEKKEESFIRLLSEWSLGLTVHSSNAREGRKEHEFAVPIIQFTRRRKKLGRKYLPDHCSQEASETKISFPVSARNNVFHHFFLFSKMPLDSWWGREKGNVVDGRLSPFSRWV